MNPLWKINGITSSLVKCSMCADCCMKGGPIYILFEEVEELRRLGVPIVQYKGGHFVQRMQTGHCSMLLEDGKCCMIYESRPISCRLFPLDIFRYPNRQPAWVIFDYCPKPNRVRGHAIPGQPTEMDIALSIVCRLEKSLPRDVIERITRATELVGELDIFEPYRLNARKVCNVDLERNDAGRAFL